MFLMSGMVQYIWGCVWRSGGWGPLDCWGLGNGQTNQIRVTRRATNHSRGGPLVAHYFEIRNEGRYKETYGHDASAITVAIKGESVASSITFLGMCEIFVVEIVHNTCWERYDGSDPD